MQRYCCSSFARCCGVFLFPRKQKFVFYWMNSRSLASGWGSRETMRLRIHGQSPHGVRVVIIFSMETILSTPRTTPRA